MVFFSSENTLGHRQEAGIESSNQQVLSPQKINGHKYLKGDLKREKEWKLNNLRPSINTTPLLETNSMGLLTTVCLPTPIQAGGCRDIPLLPTIA
ncbi:hypothetical protein CEXT_28281 [Caerostris extrusa]|uniref:Uncharacterized protein n=1 Tax=Caerostris extrusa TaxID=172846 RepID=A0AAV4RJZ8_CAEEX|nr:hypothetical protein CEXT_28281 [Caerostris extrusa]